MQGSGQAVMNGSGGTVKAAAAERACPTAGGRAVRPVRQGLRRALQVLPVETRSALQTTFSNSWPHSYEEWLAAGTLVLWCSDARSAPPIVAF